LIIIESFRIESTDQKITSCTSLRFWLKKTTTIRAALFPSFFDFPVEQGAAGVGFVNCQGFCGTANPHDLVKNSFHLSFVFINARSNAIVGIFWNSCMKVISKYHGISH
jgi:hypothetical protein